MYKDLDKLFEALSKSKFRSSFHLKKDDIEYINNKGLDVIKSHAYAFINQRLKPKEIDNDGNQTPYKGHPVFIAQHASATCCRGCLYKWHKIDKNKELSDEEVDYIIIILMKWIEKEYNSNSK